MKPKTILTLMLIGWVYTTAGAQTGSLLLSELLFQPRSGEAEYVELYNVNDSAIELSRFHLVRVLHDTLSTHYPLPTYTVSPKSYVVLTTDAASVTANYTVHHPSALLECNLPPFPNTGGSVVLATSDSVVVDRLDYSPSMHSHLLRNKAGVSLERRSFERPTNESSNWFSAASTHGYGTPTYANSQSTEFLVEEALFELSSTLLSPDGDGYQDELLVDYHLDIGNLYARAEIYDARGVMVRRLLNGDLLGTHGALRWDGLSSNGQRLPQGQYILQITVYNSTGTRQVIRRPIALVNK